MRIALLLTLSLAASAVAKVYLQDNIDSNWEKRWVQSTSKSDYGKFVLSSGKYYGDAKVAEGLKTSEDAKFYALSTKFDKFSNKGEPLVIQFSVKHEQNIDCGGGYVKLFPSTQDQTAVNGDSSYNIMFGPDICGPGTRKVHVIFSYKGKNLDCKKSITCKSDESAHLYTLIVKPDNTYEVRIDNEKVESGSLYDDWSFLPPRKINDPSQSKPSDWVDAKTIPDPEDKKPADFDKPQHIPDPEAKKPEDWDDEMDGEWEPPMIDNPDYVDDPSVYSYDDFGVLGLDLWQVKSGSIFDNFLITNNVSEAETAAAAFKAEQDAEAAAKKKAEDAKKAEDEAKAAADKKTKDDEPEEDDEPVKREDL